MDRDTRIIDKIIIHCSASDNPAHDSIEVVRSWHRARLFDDIGYHFFIDKRGRVKNGRPITKVGAHCSGQNVASIGICLSGRYNFKEVQFKAAYNLIKDLMHIYSIKKGSVFPHKAFTNNKTCPNFSLDKIWAFETDDKSC